MNRDLIKECLNYVVDNKEKRDEIVRVLEYFKEQVPEEDVAYYYKVSPILLKELDRRDDKEEIYNKLYNGTIKVSVKAIISGKHDIAYYYLKARIIDLQEQLLTSELNSKLIKTLKVSNY